MHEYSLVQAMMRRVEEEARAHNATSVHRLQVRIGGLSGVEPDLLATAYEMMRPGTMCANADLVLTREETEWACGVCGQTIPVGGELVCPQCGWPARLIRGDDLVLTSVELEVA